MPPRRSVPLSDLWKAFDEARFGKDRTLNLRASLPTADEAVRRAEAWLRQQQIAQGGGGADVLVITGRGKGSPDGVSAVREAVIRLLHALKRKGVVASHQEHTPGSFVVTLASMRELLEAPRRQRDARKTPPPPSAPTPPSLDALQPETRELLRDLASHALDHLGVHDRGPFLEGEMVRQFSMLTAGIPQGVEREQWLRDAIRRAMEAYD